MLMSVKLCCSPTKINILLQFCANKNVTVAVNLFENLKKKLESSWFGSPDQEESNATTRKSGSDRLQTARYDADLLQGPEDRP